MRELHVLVLMQHLVNEVRDGKNVINKAKMILFLILFKISDMTLGTEVKKTFKHVECVHFSFYCLANNVMHLWRSWYDMKLGSTSNSNST
jgi:hypothetical protein